MVTSVIEEERKKKDGSILSFGGYKPPCPLTYVRTTPEQTSEVPACQSTLFRVNAQHTPMAGVSSTESSCKLIPNYISVRGLYIYIDARPIGKGSKARIDRQNVLVW